MTFNSARHGQEWWDWPGAVGPTDVADWDSVVRAGDGWPEWITFDVTEFVQDFLTSPSLNYGWKISQGPIRGIHDPDSVYTHGAFAYKSSEAPEIHLRPILILIPSDQAVRAAVGP